MRASVAAVVLLGACVVGEVDPSETVEVAAQRPADKLAEKVAIVRMFAQGVPVLDDLNPGLPKDRSTVAHDALAQQYGQRVAQKLKKLDPDLTYISGLLRINDPDYQLTPDEITAYRAVRAAFPNTKFDIVLSTHHGPDTFNSADALKAAMSRFDDQLHPGVWFFDFFNEGGKEPNGNYTIHEIIYWVHQKQPGKLIGGNYFNRAPEDANGTGAADFFAVADNQDFELSQPRIDGLHASFHAPVLMHFGNNPQSEPLDAATGRPACVVNHTTCVTSACRFIHNYDFGQQRDYVTRRVTQHATRNYHYMYNVFFPACPLDNYYEADQVKDGSGRSMLDVMHDLMH